MTSVLRDTEEKLVLPYVTSVSSFRTSKTLATYESVDNHLSFSVCFLRRGAYGQEDFSFEHTRELKFWHCRDIFRLRPFTWCCVPTSYRKQKLLVLCPHFL